MVISTLLTNPSYYRCLGLDQCLVEAKTERNQISVCDIPGWCGVLQCQGNFSWCATGENNGDGSSNRMQTRNIKQSLKYIRTCPPSSKRTYPPSFSRKWNFVVVQASSIARVGNRNRRHETIKRPTCYLKCFKVGLYRNVPFIRPTNHHSCTNWKIIDWTQKGWYIPSKPRDCKNTVTCRKSIMNLKGSVSSSISTGGACAPERVSIFIKQNHEESSRSRSWFNWPTLTSFILVQNKLRTWNLRDLDAATYIANVNYNLWRTTVLIMFIEYQ